MSKHTYPDITSFVAELGRQGMAAKTIATYATDCTMFARWFTESTDEPFAARAVTPTDILDYKAHLRTVQRRQAATVNRRLAALRKFFLWAQATGRIAEVPTATVKGVPAAPRSPKSLPKRDVDRLIREAQCVEVIGTPSGSGGVEDDVKAMLSRLTGGPIRYVKLGGDGGTGDGTLADRALASGHRDHGTDAREMHADVPDQDVSDPLLDRPRRRPLDVGAAAPGLLDHWAATLPVRIRTNTWP
jgi:Phage integrase, N-terminal SAM-like domain